MPNTRSENGTTESKEKTSAKQPKAKKTASTTGRKSTGEGKKSGLLTGLMALAVGAAAGVAVVAARSTQKERAVAEKKLKRAVDGAAHAVSGALDSIAEAADDAADGVAKGAKELAKGAEGLAGDVAKGAGDLYDSAKDAITGDSGFKGHSRKS